MFCIGVYECLYILIYTQHTYMLTYTLHIHIHVSVVLCIMSTHSYLKVEFIMVGGAEVTTLLSHTHFGGMPGALVKDG